MNGDNSATFVYLCDRKACGGKCSYPECKHTSDRSHAIHPNTAIFDEVVPGKYMEKERRND